MIEIHFDDKYNLPLLYREAKKIDENKAKEIGIAYVDLRLYFKEACDQFREIIDADES